jgi:uncharacterized membrane protein YkoI
MMNHLHALTNLAKRSAFIGLLTFSMTGEGHAAARELSQAELRNAAASGNTISLKRAIDSIVAKIGGTAVDARAFESDGFFYRIVVKKPNGQIVSIIVNAHTGASLTSNSRTGRHIAAAAKSSAGKSSSGNGNSGRNNGGRNGGGNGGGNSGGNGGGSNGGNGGGNGN